MSQKSKIKLFLLWVYTEFKKDNIVPAILVCLGLWWGYHNILIPTYSKLNDIFSIGIANSEANSIVESNMYRLEHELAKLREEMKRERLNAPYGEEIKGRLGVDYKEWSDGNP
jgi:hypothetical protein